MLETDAIQRGAIVLCGGRSSRMGLAKATLPFGPEVMLQCVVRLLRPVVGSIVVVAAPDQPLPDLPEQVTIVRDRREGRGPLEGLAAGLASFEGRANAVYATGCDVPLLVPEFVERMFELLGRHEIVVTTDGEYQHPLAAVYRTQVREHVERLLAADRLRPVFLFDEVDTRRVPVDQLRDVDPELLTLKNLNRPADYLAALERAGFTAPDEVLAALKDAE